MRKRFEDAEYTLELAKHLANAMFEVEYGDKKLLLHKSHVRPETGSFMHFRSALKVWRVLKGLVGSDDCTFYRELCRAARSG